MLGLFALSLLGGLGAVVITVIFLVKKDPVWKKALIISGVCFIVMIFSATRISGEDVSAYTPKASETANTPSVESNLDQVATDAVKEYMYNNFGGAGDAKYATSWYGLIERIEIYKTGNCSVYTSIYPDNEGKEIGEFIGRVVLNNGKVGLDSVSVLGQNESPLCMVR